MDFLPIILIIAVAIVVLAIVIRRRAGFGAGKTISNDNVLIRSEQHRLSGIPDRIVKSGKYFIPEDRKPTARVFDSQIAKIIVYCILIEERYGIRPPYGVIYLTKSGKREKVMNTEQRRKWVFSMRDAIEQQRRTPNEPCKPVTTAAKCRGCGQRANCEQRLA